MFNFCGVFCHVESYHTSVHIPDRGFAPFCQTTLWGSVLRKKDCPDYTSQRVSDSCASPTSDKLHNSPETVNMQPNMMRITPKVVSMLVCCTACSNKQSNLYRAIDSVLHILFYNLLL